MGTKKKNQKNVYKEFWGLASSADRLAELDLYDVDMLIEAWKHQLKASNFFYGTLVKNEPNHDANKVYYRLNSGEPKEHQLVYAQIGRGYSKELFELGVPVLGLCYGAQLMMHVLGGKVEKALVREYGKTEVLIDKAESAVFKGVSPKTICWMSHNDYIEKEAPGFRIVAHTPDCPVAAAECEEKK